MLLTWPLTLVQLFLCAFIRITIFVWFFPLFPQTPAARYGKIGLSFFFALIITLVMQQSPAAIALIHQTPLLILIVQEIGIGLALGFLMYLLEGTLHSAGTFVSQLMGLQTAQTFAPGSISSSPLISLLYFYLGTMVLLALDGHHYLLQALAYSFEIIPPGSFLATPPLFHHIFQGWQSLYRFVVLLGAPFILLFFTVTIELGILGRMVPKMNIFMMEYPIRLGTSMVLLALFLPAFLAGLRQLILLFNDVLTGLLI